MTPIEAKQLKKWLDDNDARAGNKAWRATPTNGREYIAVAYARQQLGAAAEQIIQRSRASEQFRWVKA